MKTLAVITGERRLFCPFEMCEINNDLRILVCRCTYAPGLIWRMKRSDVCGYIAERDMKLPFERYDGNGIFCYKIPMIIKKLIKTKNINADSVAVVIGENIQSPSSFFENIAGIFRELYIISPDYEFAAAEAERLLCECGIVAQTDEPQEMCDVEIFTGTHYCGLGRYALNYETKYEVNHGYNLPVKVDSRAFAEALLVNGLITEGELKKFNISIGG